MTAVSVSGERVDMEDLATDTAGVELRGRYRRGPMVLLSASLVVTGGLVITSGAGAKAANGGGKLDVRGSRAKLEVRTRGFTRGSEHVFEGLMDFTDHPGVGLEPAGTRYYMGSLAYGDYRSLINETKNFKIEKISDGEFTFRINFYDVKENQLGYFRGISTSFRDPGIDRLIPVPISGDGEWNPKMPPEDRGPVRQNFVVGEMHISASQPTFEVDVEEAISGRHVFVGRPYGKRTQGKPTPIELRYLGIWGILKQRTSRV